MQIDNVTAEIEAFAMSDEDLQANIQAMQNVRAANKGGNQSWHVATQYLRIYEAVQAERASHNTGHDRE